MSDWENQYAEHEGLTAKELAESVARLGLKKYALEQKLNVALGHLTWCANKAPTPEEKEHLLWVIEEINLMGSS